MIKVTFQTNAKIDLIKAIREAFSDVYGIRCGLKEAKDAVQQEILLEDFFQENNFFHKLVPGIMSHFCTASRATAFDSYGNPTGFATPTWSYKVEEYTPIRPMTLNDMVR